MSLFNKVSPLHMIPSLLKQKQDEEQQRKQKRHEQEERKQAKMVEDEVTISQSSKAHLEVETPKKAPIIPIKAEKLKQVGDRIDLIA